MEKTTTMTDAAREANRAYHRERYRCLTDEQKAARAEYARKYRQEHRNEINAYRKAWRAEHPDAIREQNARYWNKRAEREGGGTAE